MIGMMLGLLGGNASSGGVTGSYVGASFAIDQSGSSASLSVPAGTTTGHTLIAILRCRADRTFTVPGGWTAHQDGTVIPLGGAADSSNTRLYVLSKAYAGEASVAFTQSVSAAYGYALVSVQGGVLTHAYGADPSITKSSADSLMLVVPINTGTTTPDVSSVTGYTGRGRTSFNSGGTHFFLAHVFTKTGVAAGTVTPGATPQGVTQGSWIAEIGA